MKPKEKKCDDCRKWGTFDCPQSIKCYARADKPHWEPVETTGHGFAEWLRGLFGKLTIRRNGHG
jgi:hypothetical protein